MTDRLSRAGEGGVSCRSVAEPILEEALFGLGLGPFERALIHVPGLRVAAAAA